MRRNILLFIAFAALLAAPADIWAKDRPAPPITVRGGVHAGYDRVVFDWPRRVSYDLARERNGRITIRFNADGHADFRQLDHAQLTRAKNFAAASRDAHLAVSFMVDPHARIRDFYSENAVVFDIRGKSVPGEITARPPVSKAAEEPAKTGTNPASTTPKIEEKTAGNPPDQSAAAHQNAAEPNNSAAPAPAAVTPVPVKTEPLPVADQNRVVNIGQTPQLAVVFDPHIDTRAAIFARAGYGYVIFDRKLTMGLDALTSSQSGLHLTLEALDMPKDSGYRFALPPDVELQAKHVGTAWQVFMSRQHIEVPVSTVLVAQPDFALGARLLLPLPDAPDPIRFTDPVVGDELVVVPLTQPDPFSVFRRMADFLILPAAQGLVVKPLNDRLVVRTVVDGLEITADGGLKLSSATDTGASQQSAQKARAAASGKSLFDFATWRGKPNETFTETRQRLMQTIVDVPEIERNRARLELARFYFAQGNGEEASALLAYLARLVPDLNTHFEFRALMGAAEILSYHPEAGLHDLDIPELHNQPEIELWQAVAAAELRNWPDAEARFARTENMLSGYPEPFYSRFMVLSIEAALATNKEHEAKDWLDRLETGRHRAAIEPAIAYLHGVLQSQAGHADIAEEYWKEAAASNDQLYRVRAQMALVDLGVATNTMTPAQAASRLEQLRFAWRGDDLELDILHRLGQFYIQAKNVKAGLNVLAQAVALYPDSPLTPAIKKEMAQIFHDMFLGDLAPDISPVDALTLYQQFHDLMPAGADGDAIKRNLAERLVSIDLLGRSESLFEELLQSRAPGPDRGHIGTRLAALYIIDRKPGQAIATLDKTNDNSYPADLLNQRQLLRAKALTSLKKYDEAMQLLQNNDSHDAKILRSDISMHAQHWSEAAKSLLDLIGTPPKAGQTLSNDQIEWLVNCAIAMSLANDHDGLARLAVDFGPAMAGTPQGDTFRILTQPEKATQISDITAAQSKLSDVDMFRHFLDSFRKDNPDSKTPAQNPAVPASTTPATPAADSSATPAAANP